MQALPINLDIYCEDCNSNEYSEHESGFYVCLVCGVLTQVRFGIGLDYADIQKSSMVIRRKAADEDMEDFNNETMMNTNLNTCANSEFGDSTATRLSKGKSGNHPVKSFNEVLMDHQKIFVNLFKSVCYYQHNKFLQIKNQVESISFEDFMHLFEQNEYFQKLYNAAKTKWKDLVSKELSVQKVHKGGRPAGNTKLVRSRRNTEDKNEKGNSGAHSSFNTAHLSHLLIERKKRNSIREQLKSRKVKSYNIENIEDLNEKKLKRQNKMNLFIEEYDQVLNHLKSHQEVIQKEIGITINEAFSFKNILLIAQKVFNIQLRLNSTYEEVIHQIFIHSGLNLLSVFKEGDFFDETKTHLTPDNFLSIFHSIINVGNNQSELPPLMSGDLVHVFKSISFKNLYKHEVKFLKYINKEKLLKLLDNDSNPSRVVKTLRHIIEETMNLPSFLTQFACAIYIYSEKFIKAHVNHVYNLENFLLGIAIYLTKVIYGLNDLPYIISLLQNLNKFGSSEIDYADIVNTFLEKADKDKLFAYYKQLPSISDVIKTLSMKLKQDERDKILWELHDFKKSHGFSYKEKFINYSENYLASIENTFTTNNILSLEKKINLSFNNYLTKFLQKICP